MQTFQIQSNFDQLLLEGIMLVPMNPIGIVQISHGMCEHKERYIPFMQTLYQHGYLCIIHDHRGHGKSIKTSQDLGYFYKNGQRGIVEDLYQVTSWIKQQYPHLPIYLLGHSMGSLVVRCYLEKYDQQVQGVILSGSPSCNPLAGFGIFIASLFSKIKGDHYRPYLLQKVAFESFQNGFEDIDNSWICSDLEVIKKYNQDPLCQFVFTAQGFQTLFQLMKQTYSKHPIHNPSLPIYFLAGQDDPCIINTKKFNQAIVHQQRLGYLDVNSHLFIDMRHEILNEKNNDIVYQYILDILKTWQK